MPAGLQGSQALGDDAFVVLRLRRSGWPDTTWGELSAFTISDPALWGRHSSNYVGRWRLAGAETRPPWRAMAELGGITCTGRCC